MSIKAHPCTHTKRSHMCDAFAKTSKKSSGVTGAKLALARARARTDRTCSGEPEHLAKTVIPMQISRRLEGETKLTVFTLDSFFCLLPFPISSPPTLSPPFFLGGGASARAGPSRSADYEGDFIAFQLFFLFLEIESASGKEMVSSDLSAIPELAKLWLPRQRLRIFQLPSPKMSSFNA